MGALCPIANDKRSNVENQNDNVKEVSSPQVEGPESRFGDHPFDGGGMGDGGGGAPPVAPPPLNLGGDDTPVQRSTEANSKSFLVDDLPGYGDIDDIIIDGEYGDEDVIIIDITEDTYSGPIGMDAFNTQYPGVQPFLGELSNLVFYGPPEFAGIDEAISQMETRPEILNIFIDSTNKLESARTATLNHLQTVNGIVTSLASPPKSEEPLSSSDTTAINTAMAEAYQKAHEGLGHAGVLLYIANGLDEIVVFLDYFEDHFDLQPLTTVLGYLEGDLSRTQETVGPFVDQGAVVTPLGEGSADKNQFVVQLLTELGMSMTAADDLYGYLLSLEMEPSAEIDGVIEASQETGAEGDRTSKFGEMKWSLLDGFTSAMPLGSFSDKFEWFLNDARVKILDYLNSYTGYGFDHPDWIMFAEMMFQPLYYGYRTFESDYQAFQNSLTLLKLTPEVSDWESVLLTNVDGALGKIGGMETTYEAIMSASSAIGLTYEEGDMFLTTMSALSGLKEGMTTMQTDLGTAVGEGNRALRVTFRDKIKAEHSLSYDIADLIFDFLIDNGISDPNNFSDYTVRVAGAEGGLLEGTGGMDILVGGEGDDRIEGGGGNDLIIGGGGDDILIGDAGTDTFHSGDGQDLIHHEAGEDHDGHSTDDDTLLDEQEHEGLDGTIAEVNLLTGTFSVSEAEAAQITSAGATGVAVPITLGSRFESGVEIPIISNGDGFQSHPNANVFIKAVDHPMTEVFGTFLDFGVRVEISNSTPVITAETRISGTEIALKNDNLDTTLQQAGFSLGGIDFGLGDISAGGISLANSYQDGALDFELQSLPIQIGEYVQGTINMGYVGWEFVFDGNLAIHLGNGISGAIELGYDGQDLYGSASVDVAFGDVSGYINVYYNTNGVTGIAGEGAGMINTDRLNAEVDLFFGPTSWVNNEVSSKVASLGLNSSAGQADEDIAAPTAPDLSTIEPGNTDSLSWAGIASGTVPINENLTASADGILDSEGDYALRLSLEQQNEITLTESPGGSWSLEQNFPIIDFGIPLVADVSANLFAGLEFSYDPIAVKLRNGKISGTYAKPGNKYGIGSSLDMEGELDMHDHVRLGGTLGLGLVEHVLTQSGKIVVEATLSATIDGDASANADIHVQLDENGFHPHFQIVADLSQELTVDLDGTFYAENKIKHFLRHDSVSKVEIDLGGMKFPIGDIALEMGYNTDAHDSKFSFGPPEGRDHIFHLNSVEDMIENMQTRPASVTSYDFGISPSETEQSDEYDSYDEGRLDSVIGSLTTAIDGEIDNEVEAADQQDFTAPTYFEETQLSNKDRKIKIARVMSGLLELYQMYDRYAAGELTESGLRGMAAHIMEKHKVFKSLQLVAGERTNGIPTYGLENEENYFYWEWTASGKRKAPAAPRTVRGDGNNAYGTGWDANDQKTIDFAGVNQTVAYDDAVRIYENGSNNLSGTVYRALFNHTLAQLGDNEANWITNLRDPVEGPFNVTVDLDHNSKGILKHIGKPYGRYVSMTKSKERASLYASKHWNKATIDDGKVRKVKDWRPVIQVSIAGSLSQSNPIYDMTDPATKAAILAIEVNSDDQKSSATSVTANSDRDEEVLFSQKIAKNAVEAVVANVQRISQDAYGANQVPGYKLFVNKNFDFFEELVPDDLNGYSTEIITSSGNRPQVCQDLMALHGRLPNAQTDDSFKDDLETFMNGDGMGEKSKVKYLTASVSSRRQITITKEEYDALKALVEYLQANP